MRGFVLFSTTPLAYITQWRMQLAKQRLIDSNLSMIDVAQGVGYQSEASFGRIFKRHFNIAPATFRRIAKDRVKEMSNI
ncbi:MAG: AraC family transcriptional activator of mtrCDE [Parasphingorhabdus sp.]|jgi:AraC family transcriptional activator of mtrCDE